MRSDFQWPERTAACSLGLSLLSLGFGAFAFSILGTRRGGGGVIDGETFNAVLAGIIFLLVCLPTTLASLWFGFKATREADPWGYASLLFHSGLVALFAFLLAAANNPAPNRAASVVQRDPAKPALFTENSPVFRVVTSRWFSVGSAALLALAGAGWIADRSRQAEKLPEGKESPLDATCPVCKAPIGRILVSGGTTCPSCKTEFLQKR